MGTGTIKGLCLNMNLLCVVTILLSAFQTNAAFDLGNFAEPQWMDRFPKLHVPMSARPTAAGLQSMEEPIKSSANRERQRRELLEEIKASPVLGNIFGQIRKLILEEEREKRKLAEQKYLKSLRRRFGIPLNGFLQTNVIIIA